MGKKATERRCLDIAMKQLPELKGYTINNFREKIGELEERPDFILTKGGENIGVEHFLVDTLINEYDDSESRKLSGQIENIYKEYKNNIIGNQGNILEKTEKVVNSELDAVSNFSYKKFQDRFFEILLEHIQKSFNYPLKENNIVGFGFICEIDIVDFNYLWNVFINNKTHIQKVNGIPMTKCMWAFIKNLLDMDFLKFIIITTIPNHKTDNAKSVYYNAQSPNPILYDSFSYPYSGINMSCKLQYKP